MGARHGARRQLGKDGHFVKSQPRKLKLPPAPVPWGLEDALAVPDSFRTAGTSSDRSSSDVSRSNGSDEAPGTRKNARQRSSAGNIKSKTASPTRTYSSLYPTEPACLPGTRQRDEDDAGVASDTGDDTEVVYLPIIRHSVAQAIAARHSKAEATDGTAAAFADAASAPVFAPVAFPIRCI